jgi:diaminopimelate decarboxylase
MSRPKLAHAPPALEIRGPDLMVGGLPVSQLAARAGGTPFYAYDREEISARVHELRTLLPEGVCLHYAMKANPMPAVVEHLAKRVDGLDVASLGELQIALDAGAAPSTISFAGPGKRDAELRGAVAAGVTVNLESEGETERVAALGRSLGVRPRVAVRVNPDFELKASGMRMGGGAKPFGVDAERVPALLRRIGELDLDFLGLHIFSGSQSLRVDNLIEAQNATFALAQRLSESCPSPMRTLNIGGGFGIPYFPGEQRLDLTPVAENLALRVDEVRRHLDRPEVVIELGRYLVGEAGAYVCEVIDRKVSRDQTFLVTNGGLHHHLAASGNFGQVLRKNYPVVLANRMDGPERETVSVVGPLCTPLDLLADKVQLPRAEVGDLIAVLQSGAYGRSASPLGFLSHPQPAEILV